MAQQLSQRRTFEIQPGSMHALTEGINDNEDDHGERAPQEPPGLSRLVTSEIKKVVKFRTNREYWDSLPVVSKLFMFMSLIDVCMVIGYVIWQVLEMADFFESETNDAKREEHLHVVLGMLVTAVFLIIFVLDAISQENDFELLACILLIVVVAGRVIYFTIAAGFSTWSQILGIAIVSVAAIITTLLACLTYNRFGWRVYSHLASDLRVKHATERTILYFAQNRFATLVKLDLQFLVLTAIMGFVMSFQNYDGSVGKHTTTLIMLISTSAGFLIGFAWLGASYYGVRHEKQKLVQVLGFACIFTFILPIGAVVAAYMGETAHERAASESLLISTILLVLIRLLVWHYMAKLMTLSAAKHDKSEKSDHALKFRMSNKHPDLLPLLKGAWLIKQSPTSPNKRRFFQLSQDHTTLRWAWKSYVLLYYVDEMETDDKANKITLHFSIGPNLTVSFDTANEYETWKRGLSVLLALLMAPDDNLEQHSHVNLSARRPKRKIEGREASSTFDAFLERLGVSTARNQALRASQHGHVTQHPLKDAQKEWKMKLESKHHPSGTESNNLKMQLNTQTSDIPAQRQSSRIPSCKEGPNAGIYPQQSLDSQGESSGDSATPSQGSDRQNTEGERGILGRIPSFVETIEFTDLEQGKFLGSGAEGAVYAAWYLDTPVAMKKTNSVHELEMTLCAGQHDNVVGLRGIAKEGSSTYIVLEYCPRGTLDVLLHHTMTCRWEPAKVLQMVRSIARGVLHLHSRKPAMLHRDLKPANVFVSHGLLLKIGDFGMSRQLKASPETEQKATRGRIRRTLTPGVIGTANYTAPELLDERLQSQEYNVERILKADVYSFGVTMWEIVQRERPFEGMEFYQIVTSWSSDPDSMKLEPFSIPRGRKPEEIALMRSLQELTVECTDVDPDRRPSMRNVVNRLKDMHVELRRVAGDGAVAFALECDLALHIDGAASEFNVTGRANSAVLPNIELEPAYPDQRVGLTGTLYFRSAGGCPSNSRQLQRVLSSGNFTIAAANDLCLYPSNATLLASVFARLEFLDLQFVYRWRKVRSDGDENRIVGNTTLRVVQGNVQYTVNETLGFDVEPGEASLTNNTSHQLQEAELALNGSRMRLDIPEAAFSFQTDVETGVDLIPVLEATLNLTGRIVAEAFVECSDKSCGENGRCLALENGENVCECACGWAGTDCDIPSGFCDSYGEQESTIQLLQQTLAQNAAPPSPPETTTRPSSRQNLIQQCEELFTSRQCPDARSQYSFANQECVCTEGWVGRDCDICTAGGACPDFYEDGAACLTDGVYNSRSGKKIYECDLRDTGLNVFVGNFIKFVCNTTGPRFHDPEFQESQQNALTTDPVNNTPFCTVDFTYQEDTPVNCTAWGCTYAPASTRVECSTMLCDCKDCDAIEGLVNNINSISLECDDDRQCVVDFGGLSIAVEAPCNIGECLLPSNPDFRVFRRGKDGININWDIFIISMPLTFLGVLLVLFGIPSALLSIRMKTPVAERTDKATKTPTEGHSGAEISFKAVSCMVPTRLDSGTIMKQWNSFLKRTEENNHLVQPRADSPIQQHILHTPPGYKSVLHGISGTVRKGTLTGVLGPSGSGKTTFLSIICGISADRTSARRIDGEILINGRRAGQWAKRLLAFVPQDDKLLSTLTVRESLMYSAVLRLPGSAMRVIKQKVDETMIELGLKSVEHSQVGGVINKRGISGGERRRVTIGMELVIDPNLMILDEPTSGLDSFTATSLLRTLKNICNGGRTVILSMHQPTPVMLDMLDQVLLLAKGFQVYLGPPAEAAGFFKRHGFQQEDKTTHIAEHMLEVVSSQENLIPLLESIYHGNNGGVAGEGTETEWQESTISHNATSRSLPKAMTEHMQKFLVSISVLLWRGFLDILRNPALLLAHVIVAIAIGVFCGGIFYDADLTIDGAQNRLGAAFFVLAFLGFWSLTTIDLLHVEREIVARETSSGYYNPYVYLVSKILLDAVLLRVLPATLMTLPLYFMMGLQNTVEKFVIFLFTVATFNITVGLIAMTITLLAHTAGTASLLINTVLLVGLLFAGHLVNIPSMPKGLQWLHHLSPFHYGFQILAVNEMLGLRLNFVVPGYADVDGIGGDVFLRTVGIEDHDITYDLKAFIIFYAVALVLTYMAMWIHLHFRSLHRRLTALF